MIDSCGRYIDYIRISVTDRCNLRCRYCMPPEGVEQVSHSSILTFDEILRIAGIFGRAGIRHIKITGGEPLVRKGVTLLIADLKKVPGIETVTMTTNGLLLEENLPALTAAGIDGINISLDTLKKDRYLKLTGSDGLMQVLSAIDACSDYPQIRLKINAVTLADINRDEICALAALTAIKDVDVRFIEVMPVGQGRQMKGYSQTEIFFELERKIGTLQPAESEGGKGPAVYYRLPGCKGRIGFISPMSRKFCGSCNRVRLNAQGFLKACLQQEEGVSLRELMRSGASDEEILAAIKNTIYNKPEGHNFATKNVEDFMSQIGG